jgi:acyl-coenzyme A synthetase/AMP-(fatty) acid ligase
MQLCGIGIAGEICIAGKQIARGYYRNQELTREKFVKNPFGKGTLYKTGDQGRWHPDGNIEFIGRNDTQVKVRGYRIELQEVENQFRNIAAVNDALAIVKKDHYGENALYAYYTADINLAIDIVRDDLKKVLPLYMIPSYIMQVEGIPVTINGKIDCKALPAFEVGATHDETELENEIESKIKGMFIEVLQASSVGVNDSFFDIGGHSIHVMRLQKMIESEFDVRM